ncbi:UDP-2,4-diacetamido-2,4,6-trideoxy-beta-L-altropyranose hydrolase [Campylobacter mucosalis]|uniref:UDP-2,4-diacetamido-2,4, 6-trideoxy-beta-L-altropyranose hydrolase n=1 Tax=Campylobacter mucosalis TaxID=202 RepID=UPI00146FEBD9|nr:UDP-2,4-diacetamido-2,4,6-trideoxy-beta-L-altropyranose hydrolase [Campylobacter mucosalis]
MFSEISNLKALIRADSSDKIGHGHIRRDLVLSKYFKNISFACLDLKGSIISEINYPVFTLKTSDINELVALINEQNFKLLIIDNYDINYNDEKYIKEQTGVKILSLDDELKPHFCDILLNVGVYADTKMYENLVPDFTKVCAGREFMLVRDEFYKERDIRRDKIFDVFVGLGGSDILGLSLKISKHLLSQNKRVALATTSANNLLDELIVLAKNDKNFNLFINSNEIAKLMNESFELLIQSSGFVSEALVLNAKFKAIKTASNQDKIYEWLRANGYKAYDGIDEFLKENR